MHSDHSAILSSDLYCLVHGVPALSTRDGQRCAALADILLRGLSEARVRRLMSLCTGEDTVLDQLPANWPTALPRGATDWQRALTGMVLDGEPFDGGTVLHPLLSLLAKGLGAAGEAAAATLRGRSGRIWKAATRAAPAHAIELADQHDAFCIAARLAHTDRDGTLADMLKPNLLPAERALAQVEGWILGVPGLIRAGQQRDDSTLSAPCDPSVFRLH